MSTTEHRRHPRVERRARTMVRIHSAPGVKELEGREFECQSRDVSLSGVRLDVDIPVPTGTMLEIEITFGDPPQKYRFMGRTVWAGKPKSGVNAESQKGAQIGMELQVTGSEMIQSWKNALLNSFGQS